MDIFVSVGSQLPFDRLCRIIDSWSLNNPQLTVVFQTGVSCYTFTSESVIAKDFLTQSEYLSYLQSCTLFISHAGIGSIVSALDAEKPVIIVPRRANLNEHRNDHQFATAKRFLNFKGVYVAFDELQLLELLTEPNELENSELVFSAEREKLIRGLKNLIS